MDFESLSDALKHTTRRRIILALYERKSMSYVDLMSFVEVTNTGKFNYHLKILGDLIEKDQDGRYRLTEKGRMAAQLLKKFPEKRVQPKPLQIADAVIIGFVGIVLTVVNPGFWAYWLIASLKLELAVPYLVVVGLLNFAYTSVVPGAVMWFLAVRRTNSHDLYDLLKPPLTTFILSLVLLIAMFFLKINLIVTITSPPTQGPHGGTQYSMMQTSLQTLLFHGLILSFVGVLVAELVNKMRKRMAL